MPTMTQQPIASLAATAEILPPAPAEQFSALGLATAQKSASIFLYDRLQAFADPLGLNGRPRQKWPKKYAELFETTDQVLLDLAAIVEGERLNEDGDNFM